jgi:DNA polymerase
MSIITIDFETYYDKDYSLSKMTTEEYINDPRFEVIGVGIKVDDAPAQWYTGGIDNVLALFDWAEHAILCHNTLFDGAILAWKYGVKPGMWFDTLCMARAIHGVDAGGSLAKLVTRYGLGEKGTEVINALGKRRADFTAQELHRYGEYCKNDADLTYKLFNILANGFPDNEFNLIDMTLRMYTEPTLTVDDALLVNRLEEIKQDKSDLLAALMNKLECDTEEAVRGKLASNKQFAALLTDLGIPAPMKISPTTEKSTYALAKTDEGFIALTEHEDPFIQQLCAVRLGTKSTIEESRVARFIDIGARNRGRLPVPLKYYGAHTGRWAGSDKVNFQNLPSRDKKKKALKNAVMAPSDHFIVNCDSSQIEARVLAWWAGQNDVVTQFAKGEDVYSIFASKIYQRKISKANPIERFVGKTCILGLGYGTGAEKLRHTLKTQPPGADLTIEQCKDIVQVYRSANYRIPELWQECDTALKAMLSGKFEPFYLGGHKCVLVTPEGIRLPNGLYIRYPNLRLNDEGKMVYDSRRGPVYIWGGAMVENVVQALARIAVGEQLLAINPTYPVVLTVHDAGVWAILKSHIESASKFIIEKMSTAPDWAPGLPVACELKYAERYGEC